MNKKKTVKVANKTTNKTTNKTAAKTNSAPKTIGKTKKPKPQIEEFTLPIKKRKIFKKKPPKIQTIFGYRTGQKVQMTEKGKPIIPFKRKIANIIKGRKYDKDGVEVQETLKSRLMKFAKKRGKKTVKKQFKKQIKNWWGSLQGVSKVAVISIGGVGITAAVAVPTVLANTVWKADNYKVVMDSKQGEEDFVTIKESKTDQNTGNIIISFNVRSGIDFRGVDKVTKGNDTLRATDESEKKLKEYTFHADGDKSILEVDKNAIGTHKGNIKITPIYDKIIITEINLDGNPNKLDVPNEIDILHTEKTSKGDKPAFNPKINWSIGDTDSEFATIDDKGHLKAKKESNNPITINATADSDSSVTASIQISITKINATKIEITNAPSELAIGGTMKLNAKISPDNASYKEVSWSTTTEDIVLLNDDGTITGKAAGTAYVTATAIHDPNVTESISFEVKTVPVESITISGAVKIALNGTTTYTAKILPENATVKTVTWSSNDTTKVTIDEQTGVAKGVAIGDDVTITATSNDGSGIAGTYTVSVVEEIVLEPVGEKNGILYEAIQGTNDCIISKGTATKLTKLIINETTEHVEGRDVSVVGIKEDGFKASPDLEEVQLNSNYISYIGAGAFIECPKLSSGKGISFSSEGLGVSSWKISNGTDTRYWAPDIKNDYASFANLDAFIALYPDYTFENTREFYFTYAIDEMNSFSGIVNFNRVVTGDLAIPSYFYIGNSPDPYITDSIANEKNCNLKDLEGLQIPFSIKEIQVGALSTITSSFKSASFDINEHWKAADDLHYLDFSTSEKAAQELISNKDKRIYVSLSDQTDDSIEYVAYKTLSATVRCASGKTPSFVYFPKHVFIQGEGNSEVRAIGNFSNNTNLTTVVIPLTVNTILSNEDAFKGCSNLKNVYYCGTKQYWISWESARPQGWHDNCPFTEVHCIDGDVSLS